ncbi:peptide ABC transporter substrate-binding protein [Sporolactobacillus spathodeae]|uniref:ABC-type oligopeptide transport system substrate-binding subunit n=1 Tax=Sporolactobacillus spathodeae TaxID=1465502 RepID=A0ABS2QBS3_9BACL|nr:peptide ABC transporter substrate-binding protein [Sporolactobacillus spathodeae]MBM7659215.1 ABC-type oligopeptide transport system substrate-binding subunit [Sporolactobacillus spathodeae]
MKKKNWYPFIILALVFVLIAGCGANGQKSGTENSGLNVKQEITVADSQELNSIDPSNAVDSNSQEAINNIYEGLYRLNANNKPVPAGAVAIPHISKDGKTYTIKLNKKSVWSNGDKVTAKDYIFAWKRAITSKNAAENETFYTFIKNADAIIAKKKDAATLGVKALDDYTLQIQLNNATPYFASILANPVYYPLDEKYVQAKGNKFASNSDNAIYNGPFVLANFKGPGIGGDWTYEKNKTYWAKQSVKLERVNVQVIKETNTAINLYKQGKLDQVAISGEYAQQEASDPGFISKDAPTLAYITPNLSKKVYQNKNLRAALSLVIDRKKLAGNIIGDGSKAATGVIPDGLYFSAQSKKDFAKVSGNHLPTNVAQAKKLWKKAQAELGIKTLKINLVTFDSDRMRSVTEYYQNAVENNLKGIKVNISVNPVQVFINKATSGNYDLALLTWGADYPDASSLLKLFVSDSGNNWGKYKNSYYDKAVKAADVKDANQPEKRWYDALNAQNIILSDYGVIPVYFQSSSLLQNVKLKHVNFYSTGPRLDYRNAYLTK